MAKFKITVIRTDEYEIECNWSDEEIKAWSEDFFNAQTQEDIAKQFAVDFMRNEEKYFIEGFGYVKEFNSNNDLKTVWMHDEGGETRILREDEYTKGISIRPISQDEDYETEVEIIKK
jgi:hypothetical protein